MPALFSVVVALEKTPGSPYLLKNELESTVMVAGTISNSGSAWEPYTLETSSPRLITSAMAWRTALLFTDGSLVLKPR